MSSAQVAKRCLDFVKIEQTMAVTSRQGVLNAMDQVFGFQNSWFLSDDIIQAKVTHNVDTSMLNDYITYYNKVDPLQNAPVEEVATLTTVGLTPSTYKQSEFYTDFMMRYGLYYLATKTIISSDGKNEGSISVFRSKERGDFSRDDLEALDWVGNYLAVRLKRQRESTHYKDYSILLEASLQQVQFGYMLLDENYNILFSNSALRDYAVQILSAQHQAPLKNQDIAEALREAIFAKLESVQGMPTRPWNFTIGAYTLNGTPLFPYTSSINVALKRYVICVYRNDTVRLNEVKRLVNRYHLTRREREIVELLQRGYSNSQIARDLCISENTAKVHLRNIYSKMEVKSRAEVLAVLGTFAGIARPVEFETTYH